MTARTSLRSEGHFDVRPIKSGDLEAVTAIYGEAVLQGSGSFEVEPPSLAEMTRRHDALVNAGYPYFVAEHDGAVKGFCYAGPYRPRPAYRHTVEDSVYVLADARGKGLGTALLRDLITAAEDLGFRQMLAVIGDSGNAASIILHRRLGFVFAGTMHSVGHKHGRWLDVVIMQRPLGPGDGRPPV